MATEGTEQQLRFRWNDHMQHLSKVLMLQRLQEQYCDITLVSEDGFLTKAHQAVLASTSTYFERVLGDVRPEQHPMVVLRGAKLQELTCLLDYMYQGKTQMEQSQVESVLEVADLLGVKGLSGIRSKPAIQKFMAAPPATTTALSDPPVPPPVTNGGAHGGEDLSHATSAPHKEADPPQTSGIDLSMAKNEPRSPREVGVTAPLPAPSAPREEVQGGEEGLLLPPQPYSTTSRKRRRLDSPNAEDNMDSASDPDWGRIGSKVEEPPRPAADAQPRTVTLTAISTAAAATGAGPWVERSLEVPCEAGPLTISLTTGSETPSGGHHALTRYRPLLPPTSPSPPAAAALKRARRRLRVRRGEDSRRRWLARERRPPLGPGTAGDSVQERPTTRALRRRGTAPHAPVSMSCDQPFHSSTVHPTEGTDHSPETTQGATGLPEAPDHHHHHHYYHHQQQQQQQQQTEVSPPLPSAPPQHQQQHQQQEQGGDLECDGESFPAVSPLSLFSLPPAAPRAKQRRTTLTLEQKVKVVEAFLEGKSQRQIAGLYGTGKTQVSGIIRRREEVLAAYRDSLLRGDRLTAQRRRRRGGYARLNQHLIQWYRHAAGQGGARVTAGMLRAKALQLAPQLGYHDFKASNGWLATFKANHNLKFSRPGRAPPPSAPSHNDTDEDNMDVVRRPPQPIGAFVEEGEAEGSCGGPTQPRPEQEEELGPARQTHDPCESPADASDPVGLLHPGLAGVGLAKPPQMVNSIGANLSAAYNLSRDLGRDLGRGEAGPGDLSAAMTASPLGHPAAALAAGRGVEGPPAKAPDGPLAAYKSEEPLPYTYEPQNRMAEAAPPRPTEYNYAPYGFPGSYYGYHFLGQY